MEKFQVWLLLQFKFSEYVLKFLIFFGTDLDSDKDLK